jgi:hypothetical protein
VAGDIDADIVERNRFELEATLSIATRLGPLFEWAYEQVCGLYWLDVQLPHTVNDEVPHDASLSCG